MASPHLKPVHGSSSHQSPPSTSSDAGETPSSGSYEPSDSQLTPQSGDSNNDGSSSSRPQPGSPSYPRLQTELDHKIDVEADDESREFRPERDHSADYDDEGYDSERSVKPRPVRRSKGVGAQYTAEEERDVVKRLDKRLVLFLALLYLLSFLDRSSKWTILRLQFGNFY